MEKILTTKEKIIYESLRLFSKKGYDGVSMREIAAVVGIKGASIYNHFKGKEEIFNAIFDEMKAHYDNATILMNIPVEHGMQRIESKHIKGEAIERMVFSEFKTEQLSLFDM